MGQHTIEILTERARAQARLWVDKAPLGTFIRFKHNKRSIDQNSRMWAMLAAISLAVRWTDEKGYHVGLEGARFSDYDWKDHFAHALSKARWMPDENGGMIPLSLRTSEMDKQEHSDLTTLIEEFAARHGVNVSEPKTKEQAA